MCMCFVLTYSQSPSQAVKLIQQHVTPECPPETPAELSAVVKSCFAINPSERPSFADLKPQLGTVEAFSSSGYTGMESTLVL